MASRRVKIMRRGALEALLLACILTPVCCSRRAVEGPGLVKVSENVYAFIASGPTGKEGLGANSGFIAGDDAVLVVDSRYTPLLAAELMDAVRTVTDAPVRYVVNTHYHPDHTWGNSYFGERGCVILARPETRDSLDKYSPYYLSYYRVHKPEEYERLKNIEVVLPDSVFTEDLRVDLGGVEAHLMYFGPGHTAGDIVVVVAAERVAFSGGLLSKGYHLNLGDPGADLDNWLAMMDRLGGMRLEYIVPGQGDVCHPEELEAEKRYILDLRSLCAESIRRGISVDAAKLSISVPGTEGYLQGNLLPFNIQAVYRREVMGIVKPDFELDLPAGFIVMDGGGSAEKGWIRLNDASVTGTSEIEVQWHPTGRRELIVQDLFEYVDRYRSQKKIREITTDGTKKIVLGDEEIDAAYGGWSYAETLGISERGIWTWFMLMRNGRLYTVQLFVSVGRDHAGSRRRLEKLETIAATFRSRP